MIRRWSYLNKLTPVAPIEYSEVFRVYFDEVTRAGLYSRQPYSMVTIYRRKLTARRKHLNQWLIYTPVLASWSNEYLKLKQYLKYVLTLNLFKFNYLMINLFRLKGLIKSPNFFVWSTVSGFLTKKWLLYFLKYDFSGYKSLKSFTNLSYLFISSPIDLALPAKKAKNFAQPYYLFADNLLAPASIYTKDKLVTTQSIYDLLFNINLIKLKEIYKLFILLNLYKL